MKKTLISTAAAVMIATSFAGTAFGATHKVQSGDTLWKIASKYDTTVAQIKDWNSLNSDAIYPNQQLIVSPETYVVQSGDTLYKIAKKHGISLNNLLEWNQLNGSTIYPGQVLRVSPANVKTNTTHTVVSGDTLYKIAKKYNTTVSQIKNLNGLKSNTIYVGQKLNVKSGASAKNEAKTQSVINVAKSVLGTKYAWGGSSPATGFDCSGFIYYAFKNSGHNITRTTTEGFYSQSHFISNPQPGDLVFFKNTYKQGISHMGIYLGNGDFIHASSSKGVIISNVDNPYWKSKFDSYKRFN